MLPEGWYCVENSGQKPLPVLPVSAWKVKTEIVRIDVHGRSRDEDPIQNASMWTVFRLMVNIGRWSKPLDQRHRRVASVFQNLGLLSFA